MKTTPERSKKKRTKGRISHAFGVYVGRKYYSHKKKTRKKPKHEFEDITEEEFHKLYDPYDIFGPFGPYWS